jgi:hypothetical protein
MVRTRETNEENSQWGVWRGRVYEALRRVDADLDDLKENKASVGRIRRLEETVRLLTEEVHHNSKNIDSIKVCKGKILAYLSLICTVGGAVLLSIVQMVWDFVSKRLTP